MFRSPNVLALALSAAALATTAAAQAPYNRVITSVDLREDSLAGPNMYVVRTALQVRVDETAPIIQGRLDLSAKLRVYIDGMLVGETDWDVSLVGLNGVECSPCQGSCGYNESVGMTMFCVTPGESTDCLCTSDSYYESEPYELHPGNQITVTIEVGNAQLPEIHTGDDSITFPFLGVNYCLATPNSTGAPARIWAEGSASVQTNDLKLFAGPVPANQFGLFYYGTQSVQTPLGNGYRCVGSPIFRLAPTSAGPNGLLSTELDLAHPPHPAGQITAGSTQHFQCWYRDPMGGNAGFDFSDGYRITFLP